jgi:hypothetical protein
MITMKRYLGKEDIEGSEKMRDLNLLTLTKSNNALYITLRFQKISYKSDKLTVEPSNHDRAIFPNYGKHLKNLDK